ncbi:MAG TPA: long-chain fatty acid--CoA ligase [Syntrophomonadaceae bacterium]|nr:long-chain fatty acid--CoA ligase [Syntrophomonadaceae bacterium]
MFLHLESSTMSQAFYHTSAQLPKNVAQMFNPDLYEDDNNGQFTWEEMRDRVEGIAGGLLSLGLEKQQRVAMMSQNSPYWTQADVGTICVGGVLVTIYPTLSINEVKYIVNDSESRYLFAGSTEILNKVLSGFDEMPTLEKVIYLGMNYRSNDSRVIGLGELIEMGREYMLKNYQEYEKLWKSLTLDDWATILYTSGTTGAGKGVILTHGTLADRVDGTQKYFIQAGHPVDTDDLVLSFLPLSHIFDRMCSQWLAIYRGATVAYADSPATFMQDLQKYNPTWFSCVPRLYEKIYAEFNQLLSDSPAKKKMFDWAIKVGEEALTYRMDDYGRYNMRADYNLEARLPRGLRTKFKIADKLFANIRDLFGTRFRFSFSASAGINPELLKFFYMLGLPVLEGYGSTETCSACTYNPMYAAKPGTIGPEANGSNCRVAEDGELEVRGAIFIGYLNKPEEDAEAFTADGWFKTGDLVTMDPDGYFRIVDRKKAIICLATGKNVAPAKIESQFATSTAVDQIFVIGDERNVIGALILPSFSYFMNLFEKENIAYDRTKLEYSNIAGAEIVTGVGQDFIDQPILKQMIADNVKQVNETLEDFEQIRQYTIITQRFTEENDQLTPTQKTKKRVILEVYKDTIEEMYNRKY